MKIFPISFLSYCFNNNRLYKNSILNIKNKEYNPKITDYKNLCFKQKQIDAGPINDREILLMKLKKAHLT